MKQIFFILALLVVTPYSAAIDYTYSCGDADRGYMIEMENFDRLIFFGRVFKNGQLLNSSEMITHGYGNYRKTGDGEGKVNYKDVLLSTGSSIMELRILYSKEKGVRIIVEGEELNCQSVNSAAQSKSQKSNQ